MTPCLLLSDLEHDEIPYLTGTFQQYDMKFIQTFFLVIQGVFVIISAMCNTWPIVRFHSYKLNSDSLGILFSRHWRLVKAFILT